MKRKHLILLLVLVVSMLLISGCGVPREGVDVTTTPPEGLWQVYLVWPLAKGLVWLNEALANANIPYSWGFAIILFTLAIKVITFPLTVTQIKGMQAQKDLQPKIQELQKKYGKDREKLSQEQMKLYQEAGVNPLSGCLPMVVQMPVLFGLYSALIALGTTLENAKFFWIPNLGFPHYTDGMGWIPELFNGGEYWHLVSYLILPALLMVSQYVMQKMTTATTPTTGEGAAGMMGQMSTIMTLMFGFFTLQVPAGLTLYWVTSNLLQMGQTMAVNNMQGGGSILRGSNKPALAPASGPAPSVSKDADESDKPKAPQPTRKQTRRQRRRK
ncbi:MAG: membrane protein insertase YidC [Caldilineaceae bacterium]|nr:membrane protein insertase YidC [Caldilineaceae bacterium]HRJ44640.1 YidC/Oxa1 family membrane protein insertase [Caldilineaceae bacterium]